MNIRKTADGIIVDEAERFEMIATELFETSDPRVLTFHEIEATAETISGTFVIHALNGEFTYRLTGWCGWIPSVALAELVTGPVVYRRPPMTETTLAPPLETTALIPKPRA